MTGDRAQKRGPSPAEDVEVTLGRLGFLKLGPERWKRLPATVRGNLTRPNAEVFYWRPGVNGQTEIVAVPSARQRTADLFCGDRFRQRCRSAEIEAIVAAETLRAAVWGR